MTKLTRTPDLIRQREQHTPRGLSNAHPIFIDRAQGARVWDVDGREYIDFVGGIGVLNVGHNHPRVVAAITEQLAHLSHMCFQVGYYEPYVRLAAKMNAAAPGAFAKKTAFFTSGAEATENAIKIARAYTGRPGVIAFTGSFHGRTLLGLTLTGKTKPYKQNFGPFAPEVYRAPFPYEYRGWDTERALAALDEVFETQVAANQVAAIIIEPVLGEGGFVPAPVAFIKALRDLTTRHGIVFISDEIQTGFGRTGKFFAIEHSAVIPDLICFAKSIGGGLPLSGVTGKAEIMDTPEPGGLGGTFGGNALACAAGLAVFDIFEEEDLLARSEALGGELRSAFENLAQRFPQIGDVRGIGPMIALEFVHDPQTKTPAPELVKAIITEARERGLLLFSAGLYGNVIRCLVPLVASEADIAQGLEALESAIAAVVGEAEMIK